jgi:hypothetical protein
MSRKILIQTLIIISISIILIVFYYKFFYLNLDTSKIKEVELNIENDQSNLIQGLEYNSTDDRGNIYNIKAKTGNTDEENPNIILLYDVNAILIFDEKNRIYVYSDKALYNTVNNDTKFYENVNLSYEMHNILCGNLIVEFSKKSAVLKDNLIYKNLNTKLYADQMEVDLLRRITKISMFNQSDKVKVVETYGNN